MHHELIFVDFLHVLKFFHLELNFDLDGTTGSDDTLDRLNHEKFGSCCLNFIGDVLFTFDILDV